MCGKGSESRPGVTAAGETTGPGGGQAWPANGIGQWRSTTRAGNAGALRQSQAYRTEKKNTRGTNEAETSRPGGNVSRSASTGVRR